MVTAICPTFGRYPAFGHLVNEAAYWFTRQTYPHKELLILNDCPYQTLHCAAPGVRVVNLPDKIPTLGQKYNMMLALARGDIVMPWEDDDISLPARMAHAVARLEKFNCRYYNPRASWYEQGEAAGRVLHYDHAHGVCHNASAMYREFALSIGGYHHESGGQDMTFDRKATAHDAGFGRVESCPDWTYVYRWGVSDIHLSGQPEALYDDVYKSNRRGGRGVFEIVPTMGRDYDADCRRLVEKFNSERA